MPDEMMDTASLADRIVEVVFLDVPIPSDLIPGFALCIIEHVPALQGATQAQTQFVFDELIKALIVRGIARDEAVTARYRA